MNQDQSLLELLAGISPLATQALSAVDPYLSSRLGVSTRAMMSPFGQRTDEYRFSSLDTSMIQAATREYKDTLSGVTKGAFLPNLLSQGYSALIQQTDQAEAAFARSYARSGGVHSFAYQAAFDRPEAALGSRLLGYTSMQDVRYMFNQFTKGTGPFTMGERGLLLENAAGSGMYSGVGDLKGEGQLQSAEKMKKELQGMESALADWKTVLNKDLPAVIETLTGLFGGNVVSTFAQSAKTMQSQILNVRHVASVAGVGVGDVLGNASVVGKAVVGYGGSAAASMGLGAFVTAYAGSNMGGYGYTADSVRRTVQDVAAQAVASRGSRMLSGAYAAWRMKNQGLTEDEAYDEFNTAVGTDVSVAGLNKALGLDYTESQYAQASRNSFAKDYVNMNSDRIAGMAMNDRKDAYLRAYAARSADFRTLAASNDPLFVFQALTSGPESLRRLKALGASDDVAGRLVMGADDVHQALLGDPLSGAAAMGQTKEEAAGTLTSIQQGMARMEEARARTKMDRELGVGGTRLVNAARMMTEEGASAKTVFHALFGLDMADIFPGLSESDEAAYRKAVRALADRQNEYNQNLPPEEQVDLAKGLSSLMYSYKSRGDLGDTDGQKNIANSMKVLYGVSIDENGRLLYTDTKKMDLKELQVATEKAVTPETREAMLQRVSSALVGDGLKAAALLDTKAREEAGAGYNHIEAIDKDLRRYAVLRNLKGQDKIDAATKMRGLSETKLDEYLQEQLAGNPDAARMVTAMRAEVGISAESRSIAMLVAAFKPMLSDLFEQLKGR